jgi:hypothetical protein
MKTLLVAAVSAVAVTSFAQAPSPAPTEGFTCQVGVFTPAERKRQHELSDKLKGAVTGHQETAAGYAFRVDPARFTVRELGEWIEAEHRCCPFFDLQLQIEPHAGRTWLRVGGAEGVKAFIRDELGLDNK